MSLSDFAELSTEFTVKQSFLEIWGILRVNQQYNISNARGIGFYWWGAGAPDHLTEFEMHSPTGYWRAYFPDGPANWHYVFIPMSSFTELGLDGSRPDATDVTAFLWTYHTTGTRKVLDLTIWFVVPPDLKGIFIVRQSTTNDLPVEFKISRDGAPQELRAEFRLRQETIDLKTEFSLRQYNVELFCQFEVGTMRDAQIFTNSGTWTKPDGAMFILIECIAGGGGGGGGRGSSTYYRGGGAGGGGGAYTTKVILADLCGDTETVTVGDGGLGGDGGSLANGSPGTAGEESSFGEILSAFGGGPAKGGVTGEIVGAGGGGSGGVGSTNGYGGHPYHNEYEGLSHGGAWTGDSAEYGGGGGGYGKYYKGDSGEKGGSSIQGGAGGAGGGGLYSDGEEGPGGVGGSVKTWTTGGGGAGGSIPGGDGTDGDDGVDACGKGGGGGAGNNTGTGGAGGKGGAPGGGGGGGGGGNSVGGKGGDGGRGEVRIWAW